MTMTRKCIVTLFMMAALTSVGMSRAIGSGGLRLVGGPLKFDPAFAQRNGLGERAWEGGIEFDFSVWKRLYLGLGAGLLFLDDDRRINVNVVNVTYSNLGIPQSPSNVTSEKIGGALHPFLKWKQPVNNYVSVHAISGYKMLRFKREIDNCIDCPSETVDIDDGFSYGGGLSLRLGRSVECMVQYETFFSHDFNRQILFGLGASFK